MFEWQPGSLYSSNQSKLRTISAHNLTSDIYKMFATMIYFPAVMVNIFYPSKAFKTWSIQNITQYCPSADIWMKTKLDIFPFKFPWLTNRFWIGSCYSDHTISSYRWDSWGSYDPLSVIFVGSNWIFLSQQFYNIHIVKFSPGIGLKILDAGKLRHGNTLFGI